MRASGRDIRAGEQAGGQSLKGQGFAHPPVPEGYLTLVPVTWVALGVTVCCASRS